MKTIVKIEIVILAVVILVAAGMTMYAAGVFDLLKEPVLQEPDPAIVAIEPETQPAQIGEDILPQPTEPAVVPVQSSGERNRTITAARYFVYDIRERAYLDTKGGKNEKLYPASITKLLTSYVVLQYMKPEDTVVVGDALKLVEEGSSLANLQKGDKLTVAQLIAGMMLPSGNDAAQVAAVAAGRVIAGDDDLQYEKAVAVFVKEMNAQAEALGMENSHFANPDGWHNENHYTTMADLVKLSEKVLAEPEITKHTCLAGSTVSLAGRKQTWYNSNLLLHSQNENYISATIGLKTGFTTPAGNCLISAFFEEDRVILIGVFGCPKQTDDRYLDVAALYNSL